MPVCTPYPFFPSLCTCSRLCAAHTHVSMRCSMATAVPPIPSMATAVRPIPSMATAVRPIPSMATAVRPIPFTPAPPFMPSAPCAFPGPASELGVMADGAREATEVPHALASVPYPSMYPSLCSVPGHVSCAPLLKPQPQLQPAQVVVDAKVDTLVDTLAEAPLPPTVHSTAAPRHPHCPLRLPHRPCLCRSCKVLFPAPSPLSLPMPTSCCRVPPATPAALPLLTLRPCSPLPCSSCPPPSPPSHAPPPRFCLLRTVWAQP